MSKKVVYFSDINSDGVPISETSNIITYTRTSSKYILSLSTKFVVVPAGSSDVDLNLILNKDSMFTYFFEEGGDTESEVSIKINGGSLDLAVSPDLWLEDELSNVLFSNSGTSDKLVYVYQLNTRRVCCG